ncbi:hypothetical protein [Candidatus Nitrosotalea okcheonensis]|uniref:Uncharacterized protein n=1 Tax=Candidatus Nitrosotalea okcheonensis TaxID=1903276 RepID=A0A2H1FC09_9ARCH|nr:hypothetical protein [Candidatus Nitrosotalea okcheonensis]SMH70303.1 conserved protein of unknown function [Candidatus Nitrosotalea okcheonensis]
MDPLLRVHDAHKNGLIPDQVHALIIKRFRVALSGIQRIEKASGINFPLAYVEPSAVVSHPSVGSFDYGILFARTIPVVSNDKLNIIIQITAPLVAYGLKGTIHAILAHEFLHYLELMRKISKMDIVSDELSGNLFESSYSDSTRLSEPKAVFDDKTLLLHITKKFPEGFRDYKLEDKVMKLWIEKNLPTTNITMDTNIAKIPASVIANTTIDPIFLHKLDQIEQKTFRLQKKKLY